MIETDILYLRELTLNDAEFMHKLVNSPGWLQFIGERANPSLTATRVFIQQTLLNPQKNYYTIVLKDGDIPVGILSLIHRHHFKHPDLGFAMLPEYSQKGLCFEASRAFTKSLLQKYPTILGITQQHNTRSINLLERLGFQFQKQSRYHEVLNHYALSVA